MYENHTLLRISELDIITLFLDLNPHYFAEISRRTKLTRPRTLKVLRELVRLEFLIIKEEANVKFYYLNKDNPMTNTLLGSAEYNKSINFLNKNRKLKRGIKMLKLNDYLLILIFGSYAKGYATKSSDIDLLLIKEDFSKHDVKRIEDLIDIINNRTGLKLNPYLMKAEEFKQKNEFVREVIDNHIILEGAELFYRWVL